MFIQISKPDLQKIRPDLLKVAIENEEKRREVQDFVKQANNPTYKSWRDIQFSKNIPVGLYPEEAFWLLSALRETSFRESPIRTNNGSFFGWQNLDRFQEFFYAFAKEFSEKKTIRSLAEAQVEAVRKRTFEGMREEAIASSQIEGAVITRKQGQELLTSNRPPKNNSERMVRNNYQTIIRIEKEWRNEDMSFDLLLKIQHSLSEGTLKNKDEEGRFRTDKDKIEVGDKLTGEVAFRPMEAHQMQKELQRFIDFANEESNSNGFLWETARAIMLHFWLAYLHPFCDGNGRTARAIFYWFLLRKNFLHIGFLPISTRIKISKRQYENAFLLTEQDGNNLTYFFDYIIRQMQLAINDFEKYVEEQGATQEKRQKLIKNGIKLNSRQADLLQYFVKNSDSYTSFALHMQHHNVSYPIARKDLRDLVEKKFLREEKAPSRSGGIRFYPAQKIEEFMKI